MTPEELMKPKDKTMDELSEMYIIKIYPDLTEERILRIDRDGFKKVLLGFVSFCVSNSEQNPERSVATEDQSGNKS